MTPADAVKILAGLDRDYQTVSSRLAAWDVAGSVVQDLIAEGYFRGPELYAVKRVFQAATNRELPHQQNRDTTGKTVYPPALAEGFGNACTVLRKQQGLAVPRGLCGDFPGDLAIMSEAIAGLGHEKPTGATETPPWRTPEKDTEERLRELAKAEPQCVDWPLRKLGEAVQRAHTTIADSQWYQMVRGNRELIGKARLKHMSDGEYYDEGFQ